MRDVSNPGTKAAAPISTVVVIGELPPPVNGQSKNLKAITADIEALAGTRMVLCSISHGQIGGGLSAHLRKIAKHLLAWGRLAAQARHRPRMLYLVADGWRGLIYTSVSVALARALGYRVVLQHRTFAYIDRRNTLMAFVNRALGKSGRHVFLSAGMARKFFEVYSPERSVEINDNLAQSFDFWRALRRVPRLRPGPRMRVGLMSNLMPEKGLDVFLALATRAAEDGLAVDFILAGPAFSEVEQAMIRETAALANVSLDWRGPVHGADKLRFFRDIDIFTFPTRYPFEAQPNVVLEAICAGVWVIAPDRGCIGEDLARLGGDCLPRAAEQDVDVWYDALRAAIDDPHALTHKRAESLRRARKELPRARANYERFLEGFAAGREPNGDETE